MKKEIKQIVDEKTGVTIYLPFPISIELNQDRELVLLEIIEKLAKYIKENKL